MAKTTYIVIFKYVKNSCFILILSTSSDFLSIQLNVRACYGMPIPNQLLPFNVNFDIHTQICLLKQQEDHENPTRMCYGMPKISNGQPNDCFEYVGDNFRVLQDHGKESFFVWKKPLLCTITQFSVFFDISDNPKKSNWILNSSYLVTSILFDGASLNGIISSIILLFLRAIVHTYPVSIVRTTFLLCTNSSFGFITSVPMDTLPTITLRVSMFLLHKHISRF